MKLRQIDSRRTWIWDQYLPESMKWQFANRERYLPKTLYAFRNFEHLKLRNQETSELGSEETKKRRNR